MIRLIRVLFILILIAHPAGAGNIGFAENFNDQDFGILTSGGFWTIQYSGGPDGSAAARLEYSEAGTFGKNLGLNVSAAESNEFTVEFDVKIEGNPSGGSKFVKFFGDTQATKNNMTLVMDYASNKQSAVGFYGDSNCIAKYDDGEAVTCGTILVERHGSIDMRGGSWGHYKAWVKRASPGEKDGEVKVWWNGALRAHFTGMDSNPAEFLDPTPGFNLIEIGGYNYYDEDKPESSFNGETWYLWIDNLSIHSGIPPRRLSLAGSLIKLAEPGP